MEILIIIKDKGFSGWKDFTQAVKDTVNLRNLDGYENVCKSSEVIKAIEVLLGVSNKEAIKIANTIKKLGYVKLHSKGLLDAWPVVEFIF